MNTYNLVIEKKIDQYSEPIQRFMMDVAKECDDRITDGLLVEISKLRDGSSAYNYLISQGYDMAYDEFTAFYQDTKKIMTENESILERIVEENKASELSDEDLEAVAGGRIGLGTIANASIVGAGAVLMVGSLALVTTVVTGSAALTAASAVISGEESLEWGVGFVAETAESTAVSMFGASKGMIGL